MTATRAPLEIWSGHWLLLRPLRKSPRRKEEGKRGDGRVLVLWYLHVQLRACRGMGCVMRISSPHLTQDIKHPSRDLADECHHHPSPSPSSRPRTQTRTQNTLALPVPNVTEDASTRLPEAVNHMCLADRSLGSLDPDSLGWKRRPGKFRTCSRS